MSDATVAALIVAIPATIASLGALLVAVIGALRSRDNGLKVDGVSAKVETVLERAVEIHSATNGTLHAANSAKDVLIEKVEGLERALAALQISGGLAATAATQAATDVREAQAVTPPEAGAHPKEKPDGKKRPR